MKPIKAEFEVDPQHGPVVRVTIEGVSVGVYLMDTSAVVTKEDGQQYGLEVKGPVHLLNNLWSSGEQWDKSWLDGLGDERHRKWE